MLYNGMEIVLINQTHCLYNLRIVVLGQTEDPSGRVHCLQDGAIVGVWKQL